MINNGCAGGNILLLNVTTRALATVIKYYGKHDSDHGAAEGSSTNANDNTAASKKMLAEWDRKLIDNLTLDALYDLLLAANFLDIKGLLEAASQKGSEGFVVLESARAMAVGKRDKVMAAEKEEKGVMAAENGGMVEVAAEKEEKGAMAAEKGEKGAMAAEKGEKGAIAAENGEKGEIAAEKAEKGAMAAEKAEKGAMAVGKGATVEKGSTVEEKGKGVAEEAPKEVAGEDMVTLKSSDGKQFEVSKEAAARLSTVLANMIAGGCSEGGIKLEDIGSEALEKVVDYCNKHANSDPSTAASSSRRVYISPSKELEGWNRSQDALFDLVEAADSLKIEGLLDVACRKIADMMKGKTPAQIRKTAMAAEGEKKGEMLAGKGETEVAGGRIITLRSSDGEVRRVSEAVARLSGLIRRAIDEGCADDAVDLPNVTASTLDTVIEYCNKHAGPGAAVATKPDSDPTAAATASSSSSSVVDTAAFEDLEAWDRKLLDLLSLNALYDVLLAADNLDIEGLLDAICHKVADMIKGKTPDEIRATFNIANDFTPAEAAELRQHTAPATKSDSNPSAEAGSSGGGGGVNTAVSENLEDWDRKLVDRLSMDDLHDVLHAANHLEIEGLLDVIYQKVADMIKGKTTNEIRATFNIANDFNPEEEAELRQQYAWIFDE
ncbi:hypothetical protein BAE44_0023046 [Dichanthelium oligosanthes]|uniref:SKP1-like protein 1A n=1 Tax=Dichanthelium oligosanthes TaxID=888268 RepID=A0A1E5UT10_9POAL|nr:hypothetical protein BAE44_0023046 [Dichanthelium oligosanthes]